MRIISINDTPIAQVIAETVAVLAAGGLVVYPTETTYGIGVDATNQTAVNKLLKYKKRREGKPLSVAVIDEGMAGKYVALNATAKQVYKNFLPGPVTAVSRGLHVVAKGVESEDGTLGIRIPAYPLVLDIVKAFGKPVTATGANASYKKRPYTVKDILESISETQKARIDLILDAGTLPRNEPSTVIDTTADDVTVLRQGEVKFTEKTQLTTHSAEETQALGKKLVGKYKNYLTYKSLIFCLEGELGAGKTQFTKGIARGLGIKDNVVSPTFTLSRNYEFEAEGQKTELVHIDTWRLQNDKEFLDLGFEKMVDANNVIVIEWADRVVDVLKSVVDEAIIVWVKLAYGKAENDRDILYSDSPFSKE
ncbi:MAG TPA: L-threonylcarbamoyladenylate synthase [Candidatus Saccharimonadia bacterium]|nr:L-threonylcarbamoyladenylate synthase [Candidatus Saccharimonadia bacterium]